jgi:hypothetical protein
MAFGGPAIFSNDPNIGIRQMGLEGFIPTPVSSITYKGNAGMNAKRAGSYTNAPRTKASLKASKERAAAGRAAAAQRAASEKFGKMNPAQKAALASGLVSSMFGMPMPKPPRPTINVPSAAEIADGITRLEEQARNDEINYQKFGPGLGMKPKLKKDVGATDLPSTMFRGGAMFT